MSETYDRDFHAWVNEQAALPLLPQAIGRACRNAVIEAKAETGLAGSTFPAVCPWTFEQMMDLDFWAQ
jgi:hypothetical protein